MNALKEAGLDSQGPRSEQGVESDTGKLRVRPVMRQCTGSARCFALSPRHELCPPRRCGRAASPACSAARSAPRSQSQPRLPVARFSPTWTPWLRRRRGRQQLVGLPSRRSRLPAAVDRAHPSMAPEAPMRHTNDLAPMPCPRHERAWLRAPPGAHALTHACAHGDATTQARCTANRPRRTAERRSPRSVRVCAHAPVCTCMRAFVGACVRKCACARACVDLCLFRASRQLRSGTGEEDRRHAPRRRVQTAHDGVFGSSRTSAACKRQVVRAHLCSMQHTTTTCRIQHETTLCRADTRRDMTTRDEPWPSLAYQSQPVPK